MILTRNWRGDTRVDTIQQGDTTLIFFFMMVMALTGMVIHRVRHNASLIKCRLLITFANSLDPDQAWQNIRPDLDPNCLTL